MEALPIDDDLRGLFDDTPDTPATKPIRHEEEIKSILRERTIATDDRFELKTEAHLLKLAYTNNKILSLSNSRTQILAHQVESTHRIINALHHRFLIADEVGLGKTIEGGLVIKELMFRYGYRRILIVCPASLLMQWQNEMQSKFNESFIIMDRGRLNKLRKKCAKPTDNPWNHHNAVICSLDFIKSKSLRDEVEKTQWDAVIIDESHRLRRDSLKTTLAYNVAEILSKNSKAFLLLSATPFRGKLEELYFLVRLIDSNLLGPFQTFYNTYCLQSSDISTIKQKLSSVIIRRTKREVGGFTQRHATTIRFTLFPEERALYDATTRYVVEEFNRALQTQNRAIGFVMTIFQKLLDSSTFALLSALQKRRVHLSDLRGRVAEEYQGDAPLLDKRPFAEELTDIDEAEEVDTLVGHSLQKTYIEIGEEIAILDHLIELGSVINRNKKGEKLKALIASLKKAKCHKVLIFTQFMTTQAYLYELLSPDYIVSVFNGSMDKDQKEDAITAFKEKTEILISTEAGGEGRNLQFCNILVNYDLPWSPVKIEQRIGRIHRFGQTKDVYIYNFSTADTVAERVLDVLTNKIKLFEESIGTPDILLGQIEEELHLNTLFMEMATNRISAKKINAEIDKKIDVARKSYEKLEELAISTRLDFNYDEYYRVTLKERKISNARIEHFINRVRGADGIVDRYLGNKHRLSGLYPVRAFPDRDEPPHKQGTFDSARALENDHLEFLAFGNPIVDTLINHVCSPEFGGSIGLCAVHYHKKTEGCIFNYLVTFNTIHSPQEFIPVFVPLKSDCSEFDAEELERRSLEHGLKKKIRPEDMALLSTAIRKKADHLFERARIRLDNKIRLKTAEINSNLDASLVSEINKIRESYDLKLKEHREQLEWQICQMKWFDKDMRGVITRTKNAIGKLQREKQSMLARYTGYEIINPEIRLINVGILTTVKE